MTDYLGRLEGTGNWVLGMDVGVAEKTPGGIVLPDVARKSPRPIRLRVVAVGPGTPLPEGGWDMIPLAPGDEILVPEYGVVVHDLPDGRELRCYPYDKVLARLTTSGGGK